MSWTTLGAIVVGTFLSEDAASVSVGVLVGQGDLPVVPALLALGAGIYLGDLGLWLAGRVCGARLLAVAPLGRLREKLPASGAWLDRHLGPAVLASRFVPGTRLPLYVAAGIWGRRPAAFVAWTLLSVLLWLPFVTLVVGGGAARLAGILSPVVGSAWLVRVGIIALVLVLLRLASRLVREEGRARTIAALSRLWRWEFWPSWVLYIPVIPVILLEAIRSRGLSTLTAANPGLPGGGGFAGESKAAILALLPREWTLPAFAVSPGPSDERLGTFRRGLTERGLSFPVIIKPDVGQRGIGVRLVKSEPEAGAYFRSHPGAVVVQRYHPGPFEAGVFYCRRPDEPRGRIFAITDKVFPRVTGDGVHRVRELIWRHPRFRMQAATFLARLGSGADRVLARGETLALGVAGNHSQGTEFRDGMHLVTADLERAVDRIARQVPGFYFGRFDIRYSDPRGFMRGRDLAIVELNGVTSEATNLYDPSSTLWHAWATLIRQWRLAFAIGRANRARGATPTPFRELVGLALQHLRTRTPIPVSD